MTSTPLAAIIAALIRDEGPITIERYMALCLAHPTHGYYRTRDPLGSGGDFTTAPEISQMFGELLGLWVAEVWLGLGAPDPFVLVELGPGRGTLMADALRALRVVPACRDALRLHFVETSQVLRQRQRDTLAASGIDPTWHDDMRTVPDGPAIVLANEFLDALPVRQFVRGSGGWHERLVGLDDGGRLAFGLAPQPDRGLSRLPGEPGDTREVAPAVTAFIEAVAERFARCGGAALFIDYGPARTGTGDSFQALERHRSVDPLARPGEADLTAHVDFEAVSEAARRAGACSHGPATQGAFLRALGIEQRAERLGRAASPEARQAIADALHRLTAQDGDAMGELFKVLAISSQDVRALPGLASGDLRASASPAKEYNRC